MEALEQQRMMMKPLNLESDRSGENKHDCSDGRDSDTTATHRANSLTVYRIPSALPNRGAAGVGQI